jgi:hypothetical protein
MKTLKNRVLEIFSALLLLPVLSGAAPLLVNYQGRLVDTAGNPLAGPLSIRFSIHDAATAGSELWFETQPAINPDNGIFSVSLGSVTPLPASVFGSDARYLEIKIGADAAMAPRTRLLSTPYALYTANLGSSGTQALISTDTVMTTSQFRLGNFTSLPGNIGEGSMVYDSNAGQKQIKFWNGTAWTALAAGGVSPWAMGSGTVILVDGNNSVGIGTGVPAYRLHVSSAAGETGEILVVSTGTSNIFRVNGLGEVHANKYYGDGSALTGIVTTDKVLKTGDTMTGTLVMDAASAFNTSTEQALVFSTNVYVSGAQLRLGNFGPAPSPSAAGVGSVYYDTDDSTIYVSNGSSWSPLASGGASPWTAGGGAVTLIAATNNVGVGKAPTEKLDVAGTIKSDFGVNASTMVITDTGASALDVAGGINAGTGNVGIVDATGKIPAISGTYFASLSGANLTGITGAQVDLSTVTAAISAGLSPVNAALSTAVYNNGNYSDPSWITSLATAKIDLSTVTTAINNANSAALSPVNAALSTAVYNNGSYANPSWIVSLATAKIDLSTVTIAINAGLSPVNAAISTAVYTVNTYNDPAWLASLATAKVDLSTVTSAINAGLSPVNAALSTAVYNNGSYINPSWIASLATAKIDLSTVTSAIANAVNFGSAGNGPVTFSTNVVVSASQLKLGVFAGNPPTNFGMGAVYYDSGDGLLHYSNGAGWMALAAGGASPWSGGGSGTVSLVAPSDKVSMTSTAADALKVSGGITAGSGNVAIVDTTGKVPALSGTYFASLSAANLTGIPSAQLSGGVPAALVDLSTVTAALSGKIGTGAAIALSQITGVAASTDTLTLSRMVGVDAATATIVGARVTNFFASTNTVPGSNVDFSTVTTALSGKMNTGAAIALSQVTGVAASTDTLTLSRMVGVDAATATIAGARVTNFFASTNTVPGSNVDFSTVTTALSGKMNTGAAIALSQITGVAASTDTLTLSRMVGVDAATATISGARVTNFFASTNTVPGSNVDFSTVTTALSGKMNTGAAIALSQVTGVAASTDTLTLSRMVGVDAATATIAGARVTNFFASTNTIPGSNVDFSTVTTALSGKMDTGAAIALSQVTGVAASTDTIALTRISGVAASTDTVQMMRIAGALSSTTTIPAGLVDFSTVAALAGANTFTGKQTVTAADGVAVTYGIDAGTVTLTGGITASSGTFTGDAEVRGGLIVSSGTKVNNIIAGTISVDPASVGAGACLDTPVAVAAAAAGDRVMWTAPAGVTADISWGSYDGGVGNLGLRICNATAAPIDPAVGDWGYLIVR